MASSSSFLFNDKAEIAYVSYDDQAKCYFYGIRVVRTFRTSGECQMSHTKRRRFREFVHLVKEYIREGKHPRILLPSRIFATAPESRKPKLERFLNALIEWDVEQNNGAMSLRLERFLGLDSKQAFQPRCQTFEEYEAANPETIEQRKHRMAKEIGFAIISFFWAFHLAALLVKSTSPFNPYTPTLSILSGIIGTTVTIIFIQIWHERERALKKHNFEFEQHLAKSKVKLEHKPVDDASISEAEATKLPKLRERLVDFASGTTPEYDEDYLKKYGHVLECLLKAKHCGNSTKVALTEEARMRVWKESVLVDHRLVPFIRFNGLNLDKAESQARFAMTTRVALDLERLVSDEAGAYRPSDRIFAYLGCPLLREVTQQPIAQRRDRIARWWLRDREGQLCAFARVGYVGTGRVFRKLFHHDADALNIAQCWFLELFKGDLDLVHVESKGRIQAHCTVVVDLEGFDLNAQLGTADVLNLVKKYVPLISPIYAGILKRFIVINAPWYVNMLLAIIKPFIPADILESVRIHSGYDKAKMLDPFIDDKYIPKYLGGSLVSSTDPSDIYCRDRVVPFGPFEPDKGESLLSPVGSP